MVAGVKELAADWKYDAVAIGYPGRVRRRPHHGGTAQPRPRMGRVRFQVRVRAPGPDHQRCGHAGARELQGADCCCFSASAPAWAPRWWPMASSFRWNWLTCHSRTAPTRTTSASGPCERLGRKKWQKYVEFGTARMIEVVQPGRRGPRGREREETEEAAEGLPAGQQRLRVHRRLPPVGERVEPTTGPPGAVRVARRDDRQRSAGSIAMTIGTVTLPAPDDSPSNRPGRPSKSTIGTSAPCISASCSRAIRDAANG